MVNGAILFVLFYFFGLKTMIKVSSSLFEKRMNQRQGQKLILFISTFFGQSQNSPSRSTFFLLGYMLNLQAKVHPFLTIFF
jgi:hypothetical protein